MKIVVRGEISTEKERLVSNFDRVETLLAFIAPPVRIFIRACFFFFFSVSSISISRRPITELDYVRLINLNIEARSHAVGG